MQALIVHDDQSEVHRLRNILARRGFMVTHCTDQKTATRYVRRAVTDLLVLKQVMEGRHTTSVALAAELNHPRVATILFSDRKRSDAAELFELIPSLHAVLGVEPDAQVLATLALSAVQSVSDSMMVLAPRAAPPRLRSMAEPPAFMSRRAEVA